MLIFSRDDYGKKKKNFSMEGNAWILLIKKITLTQLESLKAKNKNDEKTLTRIPYVHWKTIKNK